MEPLDSGVLANDSASDDATLRENGARATSGRNGHTPEHLAREDRARLLRFMTMMRAAEERGLTLYRQGKVPGSFYDGCGQEAIGVGAAYALRPEDRMCIL